MNLEWLWRAFIRVAFSLLAGGTSYLAWMAAFLVASRLESSLVENTLWLLAPVATATGFAAGIATIERVTRTRKSRFVHIYPWPLIGCAIGGGAIYWLGPMLVVFGMLAAGTASVVLREVSLSIQKADQIH